MASRSDQLHSHQFTLQRVIKALALRDPDAPASPTRRAAGAVFASVMVALLALAAVGVYGVLRPSGNPSWRDGKAMIIEKEDGARFVYRGGVLYPVVNQTSALLILGAASAPVLVTRAALAGVPRGNALGILGAPDPLPAAANVVSGPWNVCSRHAAAAAGSAAERPIESVLAVGAGATPEPLADRAILARDPAGGLHLLWRGHRYPIAQPNVVRIALGWSARTPTAVAAAVLNAVPVAPPIGPVSVPGRGQPSVLPGHDVGDVFVVQSEGAAAQYAVAEAAGVAEITQVQANLLLTDPANGLSGAITMTPAQYASVPRAPSLVPQGDLVAPATTPDLVEPGSAAAVCVSYVDDTTAPQLGVVAAAAPAPGEARVTATAGPGTAVDWVLMPPGHGALVESRPSPSAAGALAIVSDRGVRFPLPSKEVLTRLGYGGLTPVVLPSALVALLPVGGTLDPAAAQRPAPAG